MTFATTAQLSAPPLARRLAGDPRRVTLATLFAFVVTSVGLLVAAGPTNAWSSNTFSSASEKQLVALTNQSRAAAGLKALKVDAKLTAIARSRSKDMIVRDYFSHSIPPSGKSVFSILDSKGYCYAIAGENIGWNNYPDDVATKTVHRMFMESSGHRKNILGKKWDVVGIGAYKSATGKKMWTVLFADKCGSTSAPKATPKPTTKSTTPKATAKATPRPTPKPTPVPTPVRTMPPEPTDPPGLGLERGTGDGATPAITTLPGQLASEGGSSSMRVVDPSTPPGLIEAIVGDVTGFYLGR